MKTIKLVLFLVLLLPSQSLLAQKKKAALCIYFKENTKNIKIEMNADSTHTEFTIWGIGFETKAKRKKALKEYWANSAGTTLQPTFLYPDFFSVDKPQKMTSLKALNCGQLVSVEEYRTGKVDARKTVGHQVWMIKKLDDHTFLVWDATRYLYF